MLGALVSTLDKLIEILQIIMIISIKQKNYMHVLNNGLLAE